MGNTHRTKLAPRERVEESFRGWLGIFKWTLYSVRMGERKAFVR